MQMRSFLPQSTARHDSRVVIAVSSLVVVYGYLGIKFTLFSGELRMMTGGIAGVLLGLYYTEFYEAIEYATIVAFVSIPTMFVLFVLDDLALTNRYDVEIPVIHFDGGPLVDQVIAYVTYEVLVFLPTGPLIFMTALIGTWFGWLARKVATGVFSEFSE